MKESEMGQWLIEWLQKNHPEWDIYQEIRPSKYAGSPVADLVLINEADEVWVIELKKSLGLNVIRQAENWRVSYRSIAVFLPKSTQARDNADWWLVKIYALFKIGSFVFADYGIRERLPPKLLEDSPFQNQRFLEICRSGKTKGYANAGQQSGGHWTPYKETMKQVRLYIQIHPGCGVGDIVNALGKLHYSSVHSARTNLVKNLNELEQDWCEVKRKGTFDTFYIKEKGT